MGFGKVFCFLFLFRCQHIVSRVFFCLVATAGTHERIDSQANFQRKYSGTARHQAAFWPTYCDNDPLVQPSAGERAVIYFVVCKLGSKLAYYTTLRVAF